MKKKAFTLTELLVVVVIIGVLSAVVLPKFTKMLDTRKATEAESVMRAVRNEQEARCTLDKNYTGVATKLASLPKASKHFTYSLDEKGITATGSKYTLSIPSYTDGRICCDDTCEGCAAKCNDLNKDYPKCSELKDLQQAQCSVPPDEEPAQEIKSCNLQEYSMPCQAEGYGPEYTIGQVWYTVNADCSGYDRTDTCAQELKSCNLQNYWRPCLAEGYGPEYTIGQVWYTVNADCSGYDRTDTCARPECPTTTCDSEDEYVNTKCMCVPCTRGVRVNAARTSCELAISIEDCKAEGKVLTYLIVPDAHGSWAECRVCDQFPGKTGKSKDGTKEGCEEAKPCPKTKYKECAEKGAEVIEWASGPTYLGENCYCNPCPVGIEFDAYEHPKCICEPGTTLKECAAKGLVWNDQRHFGNGCSCVSCDRYYRGEGTTPTGLREDCSNCPDKK